MKLSNSETFLWQMAQVKWRNRIPGSAKSDTERFFRGSTTDGFCTLLNEEVTAILPPSGRWALRILVIEDEPKVARTLVKGLEADHFAVDLAGDGEEGLQLATEIDYDAIILDWNLPKLDGLTVLRKLRK